MPKKVRPSPYDIEAISFFNTSYSTVSAVAWYWLSDGVTQKLEGTPWAKLEWDRMIRGSLVNLAAGGGAPYRYFWLGLDKSFPGYGLGTVLVKSSIDTFVWGTAQNYVFLYLYSWSKDGHEAGMTAIRDNSFAMNVASYAIGFPADVASFYFFGWEREVVSYITSLLGTIITSYYANRVLPIVPPPAPTGGQGDNDNPGDGGGVGAVKRGTTSQASGEPGDGPGGATSPEGGTEGPQVEGRDEGGEGKKTTTVPPPLAPPPAEEAGKEEWKRKTTRCSPCCFVFALVRPEILKSRWGGLKH